MNILSHSWLATRVVKGKIDLLITGAILPESVPFIKDNPFSFEEIHEGGEKLFNFLRENYPEKKDLALGVLSHSRKFGGDGFNQEIEKFAGAKRSWLLKEIATASNISLKTAEAYLHNFLWWGVDWGILKAYPDFVGKVQRIIKNVDTQQISKILSQAFQKDLGSVTATLEKLFKKIYQSEDLTSLKGFARIWARQAADLPEKDKIDINRAAYLIQVCGGLLEKEWFVFWLGIERNVRKNLRRMFLHSVRKKS
jgi:hypothetical protein